MDTVLTSIEPKMLSMDLRGYRLAFLALLTIIQFSEDLADNEIVESVQKRSDLKYALHLPDPSLELSPVPLCIFRQKVLSDPNYRDLFAEMFHQIYPKLRSRKPDEDLNISRIIKTICENAIRSSLFEAMLQAVESLSADQFSWFRHIAQPFWYERYNQIKNIAKTGDLIWHRELTLDDVTADIQYLLKKVDQLDSREVNEIDEIKTLKWMWDKMSRYGAENNCQACFINSY